MTIELTKQELERSRAPEDLAQFVADLFQRIGEDQDAVKHARLWHGMFKYLVREIYPFSVFCSSVFPEGGVLCSPCIGNQGYDALVTDPDGGSRLEVEVSWPVDGQLEKFQAHCLNERGRTDVEVNDTADGRQAAIGRVLAACVEKARNDYGQAVLLIVLNLWPAFSLDQTDAQADLESLVTDITSIEFRTGSVYLILLPKQYVEDCGQSPVVKLKGSVGPLLHVRNPRISSLLRITRSVRHRGRKGV